MITIIVGVSALVTAFIFWLSFILSENSEISVVVVFISGAILCLEVIYLLVRFIKFVWLQ